MTLDEMGPEYRQEMVAHHVRTQKKWHKGSRFDILAIQAVYLNAILTVIALFVDGTHKGEALIQHGIVMGVIFGGRAAFNYKERSANQ